MIVSPMCRSLSSGAGGESLAGGIPQFVLGCGIDAFGEAPVEIGIPLTLWQMAHIHSHAPIGNNVGQLDAIPNSPFPISRMVMVQVNEPNPTVNFPQFLVSHFPCHVMLEEHGIEDKALGSWMPMQGAIGLGVLNQIPLDVFGKLEV